MSSATQPAPLAVHIGGFNVAAFDAAQAGRGEPAWLAERRREAFATFQNAPWPTLRDEEWRRTDIRALKLSAFAPPSGTPGEASRAALTAAWDALAAHYAAGLAHVDGHAVRSPAGTPLPAGVVFTDLASAVTSHPEVLRRYLSTEAVRAGDDVFAALHAAFWTGGTLLYVPKGVKVDVPLFTLVGLSAAGAVDLHHTLVVLEDGAEATLVQETAVGPGRNAPGLHCGAVELFVGTGARLRFVNIQNWDDQTWHFSRERALVGRDASLQWTVGGLGGRVAKVNQEVALTGQGASAQVNGVMFTTGRQNQTYLTRQDHVAPHTTSDLLYKAGLKDGSRVVWKGMIRVEPGAQRTDAYQKNDNLHLSSAARADSIPGLEIEANDVRCTHGATAGRVDEDMIFYLRSRGIGRDEAIRLVVEGFFANVYDRITLEPVRETLRAAVAAKLDL
jgi:Fe-S cluster assembly protein SufD